LEPAELGPLPDNASAARYRPQDETLPDAAVVVHHGGAGTMLGALAHGLPQVVLPQAADNFVNAGLVARCGAGVVLPPGEVTAGTVREAVRAVLADARYRDAATGIAAELRSLPSARDTATALRATISG
jgi:UDP:flavonoid glycosyltransferase YjiC (YdhE family)